MPGTPCRRGAVSRLKRRRSSSIAATSQGMCPPSPVRGSETLLVVEDQEEVRKLTKRVLEARGYTVLAARNGAEALEIVAQHPSRIHLMITDVVMPGINGREVARLACAR